MSEQQTAAPEVRPPSRRVVGSMAERIDNLEPDQSLSTSERFCVETGMKTELVITSLKKQRSLLAAYLHRVNDGGLDTREFKVESGTFVTDDKSALHCVATVTRIK